MNLMQVSNARCAVLPCGSAKRPPEKMKKLCSCFAQGVFIVTTHEDANKRGHGNLKVCKKATRCAPSLLFFSRETVTVGAEP